MCIKTKDHRYRFLRRIDITFGEPIHNDKLGFVSGGSDEYKAATNIIFGEVLRLGGFEAPVGDTTPEEAEN